MRSTQLNIMAQTLASLNPVDTTAKPDKLMEELIRVATLEGVPSSELDEAKEVYSKNREFYVATHVHLDRQFIDESLDDLFSFIKRNRGKPHQDITFSLYTTLLDRWEAIRKREEEQEEEPRSTPQNCATCFWRTQEGHLCSNMVSGYFPDFMENSESCVEWEAKF